MCIHILFCFINTLECVSCSVLSDSLWPHGLLPSRLLHRWDSPGKNSGVSCHFLLQGIFLTQGSNLGLPHCGQTLYHLSHRGSECFINQGFPAGSAGKESTCNVGDLGSILGLGRFPGEGKVYLLQYPGLENSWIV